MKPDTITIRVVKQAELDADSADLQVAVEGTSLFSGSEAVKQAKELRTLTESLKTVGIDEHRVKLRSVRVNSNSFAGIKTSSAKYVVSIKTVSLEQLPAVLGIVAGHKGAKLHELRWNYSRLDEIRSRLRADAIVEGLRQAETDARALGVDVLGIHRLCEETVDKGYNEEYVMGDSADFFGGRRRNAPEEIGLQLGNSTTVKLDLRATFRVGPPPKT